MPQAASRAGDSKSVSPAAVKPQLAAVPTRSAGCNQRSTRQSIVKEFFGERKQELRAAWFELTHATAELYANARHAYAGWEIQKNLRQTRERAQARLAAAVAQKSTPVDVPENETSSNTPARLIVFYIAAARIQNKAAASFANSAGSVRGMMQSSGTNSDCWRGAAAFLCEPVSQCAEEIGQAYCDKILDSRLRWRWRLYQLYSCSD